MDPLRPTTIFILYQFLWWKVHNLKYQNHGSPVYVYGLKGILTEVLFQRVCNKNRSLFGIKQSSETILFY